MYRSKLMSNGCTRLSSSEIRRVISRGSDFGMVTVNLRRKVVTNDSYSEKVDKAHELAAYFQKDVCSRSC
ncbi:hypothetical protein HNY73_017844 [Argiope bruennichi]|uniref:Uncharacterized protein n=1 Tax=Argiope bruennichi TaxID=94029 RepID=A0A8T0EE79_ARGBR|nr:hypothetical protein HNY73_017844 [Argiope bruennichi]